MVYPEPEPILVWLHISDFEGGAAARRHSIPATLRHDVPSEDLALGRIWVKSVEKQQSYCISSVFGDGAESGATAPRQVAGSAWVVFSFYSFKFRTSQSTESCHN